MPAPPSGHLLKQELRRGAAEVLDRLLDHTHRRREGVGEIEIVKAENRKLPWDGDLQDVRRLADVSCSQIIARKYANRKSSFDQMPFQHSHGILSAPDDLFNRPLAPVRHGGTVSPEALLHGVKLRLDLDTDDSLVVVREEMFRSHARAFEVLAYERRASDFVERSIDADDGYSRISKALNQRTVFQLGADENQAVDMDEGAVSENCSERLYPHRGMPQGRAEHRVLG